MELGLVKYAEATFKGGKLVNTTDIEIDTNAKIIDLDQDGTCET